MAVWGGARTRGRAELGDDVEDGRRCVGKGGGGQSAGVAERGAGRDKRGRDGGEAGAGRPEKARRCGARTGERRGRAVYEEEIVGALGEEAGADVRRAKTTGDMRADGSLEWDVG